MLSVVAPTIGLMPLAIAPDVFTVVSEVGTAAVRMMNWICPARGETLATLPPDGVLSMSNTLSWLFADWPSSDTAPPRNPPLERATELLLRSSEVLPVVRPARLSSVITVWAAAGAAPDIASRTRRVRAPDCMKLSLTQKRSGRTPFGVRPFR